jgi:NAD(P)-dependent dehydrogenase (short-subunit alcohol dehydrogenase family)
MAGRHVALVTGAGRGIGAEISKRLARAGAAVVLGARTIEECGRLAAEIGTSGGKAHALRLDVGDPQSVREALEAARKWAEPLGTIDWLVNNAGIAVSAPLVAKDGSNDELYERHMKVNFHGARRLAEALIPEMRARGYGRIVNVASSAALRGYRYVAAYCASKHALLGWARAAALELQGTGIAIADGLSALRRFAADRRSRAARRRRRPDAAKRRRAPSSRQENPGGRLVTVEEVAELVLALLTTAENGAVAELDGGAARYHPAANVP